MFVKAEEEDPGGQRVGLWQMLLQWLLRRGKHLDAFSFGFTSPCTFSGVFFHWNAVFFQVLIDLSNTAQLDNVPRWLPLKEQSEGDHHRRSHSGQGRHSSSKPSSQHSSPKTSAQDIHDSPKSSVIKSQSHGIFPDPAKGRTQLNPITSAAQLCHAHLPTTRFTLLLSIFLHRLSFYYFNLIIFHFTVPPSSDHFYTNTYSEGQKY